MSGQVKTSTVAANAQFTSVLTHLHGLITYNYGSTLRTFNLSESSAVPGPSNFLGVMVPSAETVPISFCPPLRFQSGISVSVATSSQLTLIYST